MSDLLGFACDFGDGRRAEIGRRTDGDVFLAFFRAAADGDEIVPEFAEGLTTGQFRRDGKVVTVIRLSDEAALAAYVLINRMFSEEDSISARNAPGPVSE